MKRFAVVSCVVLGALPLLSAGGARAQVATPSTTTPSPWSSTTTTPSSSAAAGAPHQVRDSAQAMGTEVALVAWTADDARAHEAFAAAFAELQRIELLMTDWERPGQAPSDVVRVNKAAGVRPVEVSPETIEVVEEAQELARKSGGAFDVTYAAMRGIWKFDEDLERKIPDAKTIAAKRKLINYRDLIVDKKAHTLFLKRAGMRMGLGGIAKGYAVDKCAAVLRAHGLANFIVQAGGDLFAAGSKSGTPWAVGIQDPRSGHGDAFAMAPIVDHAFSTAGDYERGFVLDGRRYHHIIDPHTGYPATASRSVTVFAPSALLADALDDAVFIIGPERGLALAASFADVGVVIVDAHNKVWISPQLKDRVRFRHEPTDGV
ncbi:MAG TPA: FAD:protein FMN transferase [Polyangia bacterium]|nr:FAD:protein FMN transferase [Polyangia bacterium]